MSVGEIINRWTIKIIKTYFFPDFIYFLKFPKKTTKNSRKSRKNMKPLYRAKNYDNFSGIVQVKKCFVYISILTINFDHFFVKPRYLYHSLYHNYLTLNQIRSSEI